jgi:hypothetical protein
VVVPVFTVSTERFSIPVALTSVGSVKFAVRVEITKLSKPAPPLSWSPVPKELMITSGPSLKMRSTRSSSALNVSFLAEPVNASPTFKPLVRVQD